MDLLQRHIHICHKLNKDFHYSLLEDIQDRKDLDRHMLNSTHVYQQTYQCSTEYHFYKFQFKIKLDVIIH